MSVAGQAPRFARARKVLGWLFFLPAASLATGLAMAALSAVFDGHDDWASGYGVFVPVAVALYVGQLVCPAPRFALCALALLALGSVLTLPSQTALVGYALGVAIAVLLATGRDATRRKAIVRALRWTLCIPAGLFALLGVAAVLEPDDEFALPVAEAAAMTLTFAVSALVAGFAAPGQRLRMLLLFAAATCGFTFVIGEEADQFARSFPNALIGLHRQDLVVAVAFLTWAIGTGLAAFIVIRLERWMQDRRLPMAIGSRALRYKGTAPYQDQALDRQTFFGREREARSLMSLVQAERLVVLFSKSGMGKSSLINAGLVRPLLQRGHVCLVVRLIAPGNPLTATVIEGVRAAAAAVDVDVVGGDPGSLWRFFKTAEFWSQDDDPLHPVLIVDQFEEIFTLHESTERRTFIRQLGELIRGPSRADDDPSGRLGREPADVRVVLAMREDFLADLEELARDIPAILHNRFRLGPLSAEAARDAIVEPARLENDHFETARFDYEPDAVERIIHFLAARRSDGHPPTSEEVEPVQLQLICRYLEESVRARGREDGAKVVIQAADIGGDAQMEEVLEGFYDRIIDSVRPVSKAGAVRRLCETRLISSGGRRLAEDGEVIGESYKLSPALLRQLVDARLLRAESRSGSTLYEISHDRLVEPIQRSRRRRTAQRWRTAALGVPLVFVILWGVAYTAFNHRDRVQELARLQLELMAPDTRTAIEAARQLEVKYDYDAAQFIAMIEHPTVVNPSVMLLWRLTDLASDDQEAVFKHLDDFHDNFIRDNYEDPRIAPTFLGAVLSLIEKGERSGASKYWRDFAPSLRRDVLEQYANEIVSDTDAASRCNGGNLGETGAGTPRPSAVTNDEYRCFNPRHQFPDDGTAGGSPARVNRYEALAYAAFVDAALPTRAQMERLAPGSRPANWEELWLADSPSREEVREAQRGADPERPDIGLRGVVGRRAGVASEDAFKDRAFTIVGRR